MPGTVEGDTLVLQGHPVRTRKVYSVPLTIECEFELEKRVANDGYFAVGLVAAGTPGDVGSMNMRWLQIACRGAGAPSGRDALSFQARDVGARDRLVWGEEPFAIEAGKHYALRLELMENRIHLVLDGHAYELHGVKIPYQQFCILLNSWQPTNRWYVRNFSVH